MIGGIEEVFNHFLEIHSDAFDSIRQTRVLTALVYFIPLEYGVEANFAVLTADAAAMTFFMSGPVV